MRISGLDNSQENRLVFGHRSLGKDEVAGSNPAISSMAPEDVVSMAPGVFLLPVFGLIPYPSTIIRTGGCRDKTNNAL